MLWFKRNKKPVSAIGKRAICGLQRAKHSQDGNLNLEETAIKGKIKQNEQYPRVSKPVLNRAQ